MLDEKLAKKSVRKKPMAGLRRIEKRIEGGSIAWNVNQKKGEDVPA
jgi:hypothetical protein